jgi:hypothetical protein
MTLLESLVVDRDGTRWGERAVELQRTDAEALLDLDGPRRHWDGRSRGYSKSDDLAAITIAVLLKQLGSGDTALVCAADRDQAKIIIDRIRWIVKRTPGLSRLLKVGQYDVVAKSGARLEAIAADAASSWGHAPLWVICDELARWPETEGAEELWQSISSAVVKVAGRLTVITTASVPMHWSKETVYDHALAEKAWRVSETHDPAPWIDPEELAAERRRLPQAIYEQLWENRWVAAAGSFLDPALIDAAFTLPGPSLDRDTSFKYFAGLDIGLVNDLTAFVIGHRDGDVVYLDRIETWQGSQDAPVDINGVVEPFIVEQHKRFHFELQADPWQGMDLVSRLKKRGVKAEVQHFTTGSKQKLAQTLLSAINHGALRLYPAEGLREELIALRLVQSNSTGAWSFDHTRKGHDDRATAIGLMAAVALDRSTSSWAQWKLWMEGASAADIEDAGATQPPAAVEYEDLPDCTRGDCVWVPHDDQVEKCTGPNCQYFRDKEN